MRKSESDFPSVIIKCGLFEEVQKDFYIQMH